MSSITRRRAHKAWRASLTAGVLVAVAAISPIGSGSATASSAVDDADTRPWVSGDHTIPIFDLAQAITEEVNAETGMDGDEDGDIDTIRVEVTRPDAGDGKVPLIVHASPYFFKGSRSAWETGFFVPRGYAVATVALPGTDFSTGCSDVGADLEVLGTKAVVDWANGRAKGFYLDGSPAKATKWSTGDVGMIGVSWDGTIANSVASTGVEGLKTIVPVAAISSWYDYTRGNGIPFYQDHIKFLHEFVSNFDSPFCRTLTPILQAASDDSTGNYNDWWSDRDYRLDASKITASVMVVAGLNDENVKTRQFGEWWDELVANGVDRKIFLHQGEHIDPISFGSTYSTPLLEWFDYYLQNLDNGVPAGPQAIIQREDGSWSKDKVWPPAGTAPKKMSLAQPLGRSVGSLSTTPAAESAAKVKFTQAVPQSDDSIVANPTTPRGDRAVFLSDELTKDLRESGTAEVKLRVKVDQKAAGFQARVVDYNGASAFIVSRTEADLGHYKSWSERHKLKPGKWYTLKWEINTDDRIFADGHVLGLVITAELPNPTQPYVPVTATIKTNGSWITMPISSGAATLAANGAVAPINTTSVAPDQPTRDVHEFIREFFEGSN